MVMKSLVEIKKIKYSSALFFGVFGFILYLVGGIIQLLLKPVMLQVQEYAELAAAITPMQAIVWTPIAAAIIFYVFAVFGILVYNLLSKQLPIRFES